MTEVCFFGRINQVSLVKNIMLVFFVFKFSIDNHREFIVYFYIFTPYSMKIKFKLLLIIYAEAQIYPYKKYRFSCFVFEPGEAILPLTLHYCNHSHG